MRSAINNIGVNALPFNIVRISYYSAFYNTSVHVNGVFNFGGNPLNDYRLAMPSAGTWREVLNTDAEDFGGSGVGNYGAVVADNVPWGGRDASAVIQVPPLGGLWLTLDK